MSAILLTIIMILLWTILYQFALILAVQPDTNPVFSNILDIVFIKSPYAVPIILILLLIFVPYIFDLNGVLSDFKQKIKRRKANKYLDSNEWLMHVLNLSENLKGNYSKNIVNLQNMLSAFCYHFDEGDLSKLETLYLQHRNEVHLISSIMKNSKSASEVKEYLEEMDENIRQSLLETNNATLQEEVSTYRELVNEEIEKLIN